MVILEFVKQPFIRTNAADSNNYAILSKAIIKKFGGNISIYTLTYSIHDAIYKGRMSSLGNVVL